MPGLHGALCDIGRFIFLHNKNGPEGPFFIGWQDKPQATVLAVSTYSSIWLKFMYL